MPEYNYVKPHPTILGAFVICDKNDPQAIYASITTSKKPCNCCNFKKANK